MSIYSVFEKQMRKRDSITLKTRVADMQIAEFPGPFSFHAALGWRRTWMETGPLGLRTWWTFLMSAISRNSSSFSSQVLTNLNSDLTRDRDGDPCENESLAVHAVTAPSLSQCNHLCHSVPVAFGKPHRSIVHCVVSRWELQVL